MLFPTALLAFVIYYVVERLLLAYYYKKPPLFDESILLNTLTYMQYALPINFILGFWFFTNQEMFYEHTSEHDSNPRSVNQPHTLSNSFGWQMTHAYPFILAILGFIAYQVLVNVVWKELIGKKKLMIIENLSPFSSSLQEQDQEHLLEEEKYYRGKKQVARMTEDQYARFSHPKQVDKVKYVTETPSYNLLHNNKYTELFCYFHPCERNQVSTTLATESDFTFFLLNLGYLTPDQIEEIMEKGAIQEP